MKKKRAYTRPEIELLSLCRPLSLLAELSFQSEVEEYEDFGEI